MLDSVIQCFWRRLSIHYCQSRIREKSITLSPCIFPCLLHANGKFHLFVLDRSWRNTILLSVRNQAEFLSCILFVCFFLSFFLRFGFLSFCFVTFFSQPEPLWRREVLIIICLSWVRRWVEWPPNYSTFRILLQSQKRRRWHWVGGGGFSCSLWPYFLLTYSWRSDLLSKMCSEYYGWKGGISWIITLPQSPFIQKAKW